MYCPDCEEEFNSDDKYCLICGAEMNATGNSNRQEILIENEMDETAMLSSILDVFGLDLRGDIETSISQSNKRSISVEFASSLGKVLH